MVRVFGEHEAGARARRQNVFVQIAQVDAGPDTARHRLSLGVGHVGIFAEIGSRIAEGGLAQPLEAFDVPLLENVFVGVEIDGKIEEIRDERRRTSIFRRGGPACSTFSPSTMRMSGRSTVTNSSGMMS